MALDTTKIIQHNLPAQNYFPDEHAKTQIFIHHTAGADNAIGVVDGWKTRVDKVATAFVIGGDGSIVQAFSSKCWGYHLGLQTATFKKLNVPYSPLDKGSIGIEMCNWGFVSPEADGSYKTYVNSHITKEQVLEIAGGYRGFKFYHKYTDAQLASLKNLLIYLCDKYNIPKTFHPNMFEVNADALKGTAGIWTHTSVRFDKYDCSPQPNLISMLSNLSGNVVV